MKGGRRGEGGRRVLGTATTRICNKASTKHAGWPADFYICTDHCCPVSQPVPQAAVENWNRTSTIRLHGYALLCLDSWPDHCSTTRL